MLHDREDEADNADETERFIVREGEAENGKNVWELKIHHSAHAPGVDAHQPSLQLPTHDLHETGSQRRRAAKSVSGNLVEGYDRRRYKAEFLRFLIFAEASSSETEEHLHSFLRPWHAAAASAAARWMTEICG